MAELQSLIARFRELSTPHMYEPESFRLACTVDGPATAAEIESARLVPGTPSDLLDLWRVTRGARLFEDVDHGQWGLRLLSPTEAARRTAAESSARPTQFATGDVVFAEFLGEQDLLVATPVGSSAHVLVALPLDERHQWPALGTLAEVLGRYLETNGEKYWSCPSRERYSDSNRHELPMP